MTEKRIKRAANTRLNLTGKDDSILLFFVLRVFGGAPSTETGQENTKFLREALAKTGKTFDPSTHAAATYESYFSFTHHNEIWISAASQQQN